MGNLTQIGRILLAMYMAYVAKSCNLLDQKVRDLLWILSLVIFTVVSIAAVINLMSALVNVLN